MPTVLQRIASVAPTIAGALGGPLARRAVEFLSRQLGLPDASPDKVLQKLESADVVRLRELDVQFQLELERIQAQDRASAREREVQTQDYTPRVLALGLTVSFLAVLVALMFVDVPQGSREVLYILAGALASAYMAVITYYFGSSSGSSVKNEMLKKLLEKR